MKYACVLFFLAVVLAGCTVSREHASICPDLDLEGIAAIDSASAFYRGNRVLMQYGTEVDSVRIMRFAETHENLMVREVHKVHDYIFIKLDRYRVITDENQRYDYTCRQDPYIVYVYRFR